MMDAHKVHVFLVNEEDRKTVCAKDAQKREEGCLQFIDVRLECDALLEKLSLESGHQVCLLRYIFACAEREALVCTLRGCCLRLL